ncbi:MAG: hypothetical protein MPEBLZ_02211 [Candidatus Methanoperedens nitroreducens]|uniref:Uncharacterized protein n=1 Tax=Candidatus Methanoperedens nitratireducens TaxID=1392998 RepID=A0A0P8AFZ8_9EURY|nr:hypothetical protein [Candidatus Methanoperedens sp. BLZ2]KAB2947251.1 MAG: hypothetical protein F9K14_04125 [Candidatus Methanoperedens sp.]KPQ43253.1 MAG: hypothetical protein MPEBLZ_02211 [Candidatus Methanoperedens sp. BLZ1]MBZ0175394.1 hypothetical protein [Candidatus Methanoperedens nitroreducens]MCX9079656.1 hypothetical protein [Candidatus Methanoperedens sp.]
MNNNNDLLDIKSLSSYGIHGALGLLMGIGVGYIAFYMITILNSVSSLDLIGVSFAFASLIIYGLFGLYIGYVFGGQKKSSVASIKYATAGIVGGFVSGFLLFGEYIKIYGLLDPLLVTLVFVGPILGFPKIKNIVIMTISCISGAVLGYGLNLYAQNIVVYVNSTWTGGGLYALIIGIILTLFEIGIAGASIAFGMYFIERTAYTVREIPRFLKITRGAGIILAFIIIFASASLFLGVAKYATTDVSIDISSADGNATVFVPVILEDGIVMKMYGNPAISGYSKAEIIDTDHGKAFKISGSGPIGIKMNQTGGWLAHDQEAEEKFVNGFTLSTSNTTRFGEIHDPVDVWIYSKEDGAMFSISIKRDNGWGRDMRISTQRNEKLIRGWQVVRLSVGSMMYD